MEPYDANETRAQNVAKNFKLDIQSSTSGEHLARRLVAGALLVCGLGIIVVKIVLAAMLQIQATWGFDEVLLILSLCGGSLAILFTSTVLSVMVAIWPWGKNGHR